MCIAIPSNVNIARLTIPISNCNTNDTCQIMISFFDCTLAPPTTGRRQLDFCESYPQEQLLYQVFSIQAPVQRYIISPVSRINFNVLSPAFFKLLYSSFSHFILLHMVSNFLEFHNPSIPKSESCSWSYISLVSFLSTWSTC